ncbi:MAG: hypothetical protein ACLPWG_16640 [Steroidobacteraceae bacterium]
MPAASTAGELEVSRKKAVQLVLAALTRHGLLLKQDKTIPNVVGIVTGESLRTSWWSHPKSHLIFSVLTRLADDPKVLFAKLLDRKDTLVHLSLWPALLAVGSAREPWQIQGLSASAADLLKRVDRGNTEVRSTGLIVKELQIRLLATAHEVHTDSGRHELLLESWSAWSERVGCKPLKSSADGRQILEQATVGLGAPLKALPWPARSSGHRSA